MMVKQKGFGLIELMISLLVSVIIMAGLYGLLTSSIVNFGFSKASSDAVDTAHRVDNFFNVLLFQAGFINFERAINAEGWAAGAVNLSGVSFPAWEADQFVYANNNHSILIRYYGSSVDDDTTHHEGIDADASNGFITDCGGVAVGRETLVTAYFTANENGLICQYNDRTNNNDKNPDPVVLDASVRSLMFEFGSTWDPKFFDKNNDGFYTADEINGNTDLKWSHVDIVRYSFITSQPSNQRLIKSNKDMVLRHFNMPKSTVGSGEAGTASANNDDYSYRITDENDRSNVHRVITGTIYLVNASKTVGEN